MEVHKEDNGIREGHPEVFQDANSHAIQNVSVSLVNLTLTDPAKIASHSPDTLSAAV